MASYKWQKMKIAWFTDTWLPTMDGVVCSLLSFKEELEKRGHEVYIFVPGKENRDDFDNRIFYYKSRVFGRYPNYRMVPLRSLLSPRTDRIIDRVKPDIVHSHSPAFMGLHGLIASRRGNTPLIFTYHTFLGDSVYLLSSSPFIQNAARKFLNSWLKWYFGRCDGIIAPSMAASNEISAFTEKHIEVIPTGINPERFAGGDGRRGREDMGLENEKVILHVGRVVKEKNLDLMIDAAPVVLDRFPDAKFVIVGEGPYSDELKRRVNDTNVERNFIFTGFLEDEKLPDYYQAADIFAFPSKYETQGIVALEAMAAGLPVVAARVRALPEVVEDGKCGFLFDADDAGDFAEKMVMAIEGSRERMSSEAKRIAALYSIEKCTDRLLSFYGRFTEGFS